MLVALILHVDTLAAVDIGIDGLKPAVRETRLSTRAEARWLAAGCYSVRSGGSSWASRPGQG